MQSDRGAEVFTSINRKLSQLPEPQTQECLIHQNKEKKTQERFIYRVHEHLRTVKSKAYEPDILAIGPYHRGKESCKMMEEHKLRYLQKILLKHKKESVQTYISAIGKSEQKAHNCYAEPISLSQAEFTEMLILDGCFIIELVRKADDADLRCDNDPIFQMEWIINSLQRDLILFENQIPFFVLCDLFDLIEAPNQCDRLIYLLSVFCKDLFPGAGHRDQADSSLKDIKHLVDLIHSCWKQPPPDSQSSDGVHCVDVDCFRVKREKGSKDREKRFIHSAAELKDANVKFEKRKTNSERESKDANCVILCLMSNLKMESEKRESCDTLFDVKFENGKLQMPPLTIEDRTECFLRNLIAFEQYFPDVRQNYITCYVIFLDRLINHSKDVDILSECGIIDSWLGDNEVVANLFNQLADSVVVAEDKFVYAETFENINAHYTKRRNRAKSVLRRDYFSNPWAYFSFVVALALLLLTVAQTVCSVLQVVYSKKSK